MPSQLIPVKLLPDSVCTKPTFPALCAGEEVSLYIPSNVFGSGCRVCTLLMTTLLTEAFLNEDVCFNI